MNFSVFSKRKTEHHETLILKLLLISNVLSLVRIK